MGVIKSAWETFVTQVKGDTPFSTEIKKFIVGFKDQQIKVDKFPVCIINLNNIDDENISNPHKLWSIINASLIIKVTGTDTEALVSTVLDLLEKGRNAVLKDSKIGGTATDTNIIPTNEVVKFGNNFLESELIFEIITNRYTGGSI